MRYFLIFLFVCFGLSATARGQVYVLDAPWEGASGMYEFGIGNIWRNPDGGYYLTRNSQPKHEGGQAWTLKAGATTYGWISNNVSPTTYGFPVGILVHDDSGAPVAYVTGNEPAIGQTEARWSLYALVSIFAVFAGGYFGIEGVRLWMSSR